MVGVDPCYCAPSWQCFQERAVAELGGAEHRGTEVCLKQTKDCHAQFPTDRRTVSPAMS